MISTDFVETANLIPFSQPIESQCCHLYETTQMVFSANQLTGIYDGNTDTIYSYDIHDITEKLAPSFFSCHFAMPRKMLAIF